MGSGIHRKLRRRVGTRTNRRVHTKMPLNDRSPRPWTRMKALLKEASNG